MTSVINGEKIIFDVNSENKTNNVRRKLFTYT